MGIELAMDYPEAVRMLGVWGYLSTNELANLLIKRSSDYLIRRAVSQFKARWGEKYELSGDDHLDEKTAGLMRRRFCNCSDEPQSIGEGLRRWDANRLGWGGDVRVGTLSFTTAQQFTRDQVASACNMDLVIRRTNLNISADERFIDGPGQVLAQAFLPRRPSAATDRLTQEFDTSESRLSQHAFNIVVLHETGHSLGLDHDASSAVAVMDPFLNESLTGWLAPDIRELQMRYGPPTNGGPPPSSPDEPGGDSLDRLCPEMVGVMRAIMRVGERGAERALRKSGLHSPRNER